MPTHNLIEYSDNYSKASKCLWRYCRDEPALNVGDAIIHFPNLSNNIALFKFKQNITSQTGADRTKDIGLKVSPKYLANLWGRPKYLSIDCEINFKSFLNATFH